MINTKMPNEVRDYFTNGRRKPVNVIANDDYTITITFDNGEHRNYNVQGMLDSPLFQFLKDKRNFKTVYIDEFGSICWDKDPNVDSRKVWENKVDLCPDSCYIYSTPISECEFYDNGVTM